MEQGGLPETEQLDSLFETLTSRERRRLFYYLREHGSATKSELVDVLTGWAATDREERATTHTDWSRMQTRLHHIHLPKLEDHELVEYDSQTDVIQLTDLPSWVERCLDAAFESEQELAAAQGQPVKFVPDEPD